MTIASKGNFSSSPPPAALGAGLLALALGANLAWISRVWHMSGVATSACYILIALWGLARSGFRAPAAAVALGAAWAALVAARALWMGPLVESTGLQASQMIAGLWVFLAAACWSGSAASAEDEDGVRSPRAAAILLGAIALAGGLMAVYAIWQRYIGFPLSEREIRANPGAYASDSIMEDALLFALELKRVGGTFGDANVCAGFLATGLAAALGLAATVRSRATWVAAAIIGPLCLFAGALTQSRGGALSLLFALGGGAMLAGSGLLRHTDASRRRAVIAGLAALGLVGIFVGACVLRYTSLGAEWRRRLTVSTTIRERVRYLTVARDMWAERPWLGYGPGSYELRYPIYREEGQGGTKDPHNWVARYAAEEGLLGLGLFCAWLAACWRASKASPDSRLRAAVALASATTLLNGLFDYSLWMREIYLLLCLWLGALAGMGSPAVARRAGGLWTLVAACLVAAGFSWPSLFRFDLAQQKLWIGRQRMDDSKSASEHGDSAGGLTYAVEARKSLLAARRLEPGNPWTLDSLAQIELRVLGGLKEALELSTEAVSLNRLSGALLCTRAQILWAMGEREAALADWGHAIERHPMEGEAYAQRGSALAALGRREEALADAERAFGLATIRSNRERYQGLIDSIRKQAASRPAEPG